MALRSCADEWSVTRQRHQVGPLGSADGLAIAVAGWPRAPRCTVSSRLEPPVSTRPLVAGPDGNPIDEPLVVGELSHPRPVRIHDMDLDVAVAVASEHDLLAVGR